MNDLPLNTSLPFDMPEGWTAVFLTNASNDERSFYEMTINLFDWEQAYQSRVKLVVCDEATDIDGTVVESLFSVWCVYDPNTLSEKDKQEQAELHEQMVELYEQFRNAADADIPLVPLPEVFTYRPNLRPYWDYFRALHATYHGRRWLPYGKGGAN